MLNWRRRRRRRKRKRRWRRRKKKREKTNWFSLFVIVVVVVGLAYREETNLIREIFFSNSKRERIASRCSHLFFLFDRWREEIVRSRLALFWHNDHYLNSRWVRFVFRSSAMVVAEEKDEEEKNERKKNRQSHDDSLSFASFSHWHCRLNLLSDRSFPGLIKHCSLPLGAKWGKRKLFPILDHRNGCSEN